MSDLGYLIAVDPGPTVSGVVILDTDSDPPEIDRIWPEIETEALISDWPAVADYCRTAIVEYPAFYGAQVSAGSEVFDTCFVCGRLFQRAKQAHPAALFVRYPRTSAKRQLLGLARGTDPQVRQALLDLYGGKLAAVGTKKSPGPLYGVRKHAWAALAVGVGWLLEQEELKRLAELAAKKGHL